MRPLGDPQTDVMRPPVRTTGRPTVRPSGCSSDLPSDCPPVLACGRPCVRPSARPFVRSCSNVRWERMLVVEQADAQCLHHEITTNYKCKWACGADQWLGQLETNDTLFKASICCILCTAFAWKPMCIYTHLYVIHTASCAVDMWC